MFRSPVYSPRSYRGISWVAFGLGISSTLSFSAVVRVPADQPTIQAGIDAAAEKDTVLVAPGTYTGPGNREITFRGIDRVLMSEGGAEVTILELGGNGRGIRLHDGESPSSRIEGFTVRNGDTGIQCLSSSPVVVRCVFEDHRSDGGNGAYVSSSTARFELCTFANNSGVGEALGGAFLASGYQNETVVLLGCTFLENDSDYLGGAIYAQGVGLHLIGCTFERNMAYTSAGAVYVYEGSVTARNCRFAGNRVFGDGGALYGFRGFSGTVTASLENCVFIGNVAERAGAMLWGGALTADTSTFSRNFASNEGGGLVLGGPADTTVFNRTVIWGNCTDGSAPEISAGSSALVFQCCAVDSSGISEVGEGSVQYGADNLFTDPLFCETFECTEIPSTAGNFRLSEGSPCLPENSPCSLLIGALPGECAEAMSVGACCLWDGSCELLSGDECLRLDGSFAGGGSSCIEAACAPAGACCLTDGSCVHLTEAFCASRSGSWSGADVECGVDPCPPGGACCLAEEECVIANAETCEARGGTFLGIGTGCNTGCGRNATGVLLVHAVPTLSFTTDNDGYCGASGLTECGDAVTTVFPGPETPIVFFVLAAFSSESSPSVMKAMFGISYDSDDIGILDYGSCGDFEEPSAMWPASGEGTVVSWVAPRTETLFEVYWFAAENYYDNPRRLDLAGYPIAGAGFWETSDYGDGELAQCLGALGFDMVGKSCCPWSPIGACCDADGACEILSEDDCASVGGEFRLGWLCDPDPCAVTSIPDSGSPIETGLRLLEVPVPNPVRNEVRFELNLPKGGEVTLEIFDAAGRHVATPLRGTREPGTHLVHWTGLEKLRVSDGVYYARVEAFGRTEAKSFVLIR